MVNTWFRQETQLVLCLAFCASWQQCQFNLEGVWICTLFLNNSQLFLTEYAPHTGHRWLLWTPDTPPMNPTTVALSCCMLPTACPCRLTTQHLHSKLTSMHSYSGLSIWLPCLFWYKKGERRSKTTLSLLCKKPWVRSLSKYFVARVLHFPSLFLSKTEGFFFLVGFYHKFGVLCSLLLWYIKFFVSFSVKEIKGRKQRFVNLVKNPLQCETHYIMVIGRLPYFYKELHGILL